MSNVIFFNKLAALRLNPTMKNLIALAKESPELVDEELNDFAISRGHEFSFREHVFWLLGYIQGVCAYKYLGTNQAVLKELEARVIKYYKGGDFKYRLPYKAAVRVPITDKTDPPTRA